MENIDVTKNNTTQVDVLLNEIKSKTMSKEEFQTKFGELQAAIEQRDKDVDKQTGDLEAKLDAKLKEEALKQSEYESKYESKMAELVEKLSNALPKVDLKQEKKDKKEEDERKYGNSLGEFMTKVRHVDPELKALAEGAGNTGGYLVPPEYSSEILRVSMETSVVRTNGARVINMLKPELYIPALNMSSNAAGSIYGGMAAYWTEENAEKTESEPTFKQVKLKVKKLAGYTESSDELDDDSILSLGSLLSEMFGEVIAFEEDYAFLTGNGVGKPLGITVAPAFITVSRNSGSLIVTDDIIDILARFKGNLSRAKWVINQASLPQICKLMDENDNYIWHPGTAGSVAGSIPGTLYGIPIIITEKAPTVAAQGGIMLIDFGFYLIGDRSGLAIDESMHYKFKNDKKCWRVVKRVDGQPWIDSAITPRGGSTLSPFVGIAVGT
jgi:HK97 family phage major capsid protein